LVAYSFQSKLIHPINKNMFRLFKTNQGIVAEKEAIFFILKNEHWDNLVNHDNLFSYLKNIDGEAIDFKNLKIAAPIDSQEIWAAGVTYFRSKKARMEESKDSGGDNFYDKVYEAERPELFFKSLPHRVAGPDEQVNIRRDASWNVPEPELTLFINRNKKIVGYTIGNDMSSRDIEGENPLYLPQAKTYDRSAAIGPCLLVLEKPISPDTSISIDISRNNITVFKDSISISQMKRSHQELVDYLFRECDFPTGCYLMTGTGIVPPNDFTLEEKDVISISIDHIGTLKNIVGKK
jgi:2-dehydro-3-deoxy-D-arabinonate dehydratase